MQTVIQEDKIIFSNDRSYYVLWRQKSGRPIPVGKGSYFTPQQRIKHNKKKIGELQKRSGVSPEKQKEIDRKIVERTKNIQQIQEKTATITDKKDKDIKERLNIGISEGATVDKNGEVVKTEIASATKKDCSSMDKDGWYEEAHFGYEFIAHSNRKELFPGEYTADMFVIKKDKKVVGAMLTENKKDSYKVQFLETAPNIRKSKEIKGLGTSLLLKSVDESRKTKHGGKISLGSVMEAIPFYEKMGFKKDFKVKTSKNLTGMSLSKIDSDKLWKKFH